MLQLKELDVFTALTKQDVMTPEVLFSAIILWCLHFKAKSIAPNINVIKSRL